MQTKKAIGSPIAFIYLIVTEIYLGDKNHLDRYC